MLQAGDRFGDGFSLHYVHYSDAREVERTLQETAIQLTWKDRHIDFPCDQCINRVCMLHIGQTGGVIKRARSFQYLRDDQAQGSPGRADGKTLAAELSKLRNRLGIPVKNEYHCIEYSTERIEGVRITRLSEIESGEGRLHSRARVTQKIK